MYKPEQRVIEDMIVSKNSSGEKRIFTGGESVLKLPFTISFMDEGDYVIHISKGHVTVNKQEEDHKI